MADENPESLVSSIAPRTSPSSSGSGQVPWYRISLRTTNLIFLPLLSVAGFFGTWVLSSRNGTFAIISESAAAAAHSLTAYTGIRFIDRQLSVLVIFFLPVLDSSNGDLTLFSVFGLGQFGAAWTLLMMESFRFGNARKAVSFIGAAGFFVQNISFTVTVPLYLLLHILTSPVANPSPKPKSVAISSLDLRLLPVSITLGYLVPSILMGLPSNPDVHQWYIAFWQAFPLWTVAIHWSSKYFCGLTADKVSNPVGISYISTAGHVYRFVLILCTITHIPPVAIALIPSTMLPDSALIFSRFSSSNLYSVFIPYSPFLNYQASSLAEGVHNFLLWDLYIGIAALLLWAILLCQNVVNDKAILDPNISLPTYRKLLLWFLISGPMGAVTILLWERDAVVLRQKIKQGI